MPFVKSELYRIESVEWEGALGGSDVVVMNPLTEYSGQLLNHRKTSLGLVIDYEYVDHYEYKMAAAQKKEISEISYPLVAKKKVYSDPYCETSYVYPMESGHPKMIYETRSEEHTSELQSH